MVQGMPPLSLNGFKSDLFSVTIGITVGLFGSTSLVFSFMGIARWFHGGESQQKAQIGTAF